MGSAPRLWASHRSDKAFGCSRVVPPACHGAQAMCSSVECGPTVGSGDSLLSHPLLCVLLQAVTPALL